MRKTALVSNVLWKLAPDDTPPDFFPDGILFHSFYRQPEVAIVLGQIARSFGEDPLPTPALAAQRALSRRHVPTKIKKDLSFWLHHPSITHLSAACWCVAAHLEAF